MGSYLEDYLEGLSEVPGELQRNFSMVQQLDEKAQDLVRHIETNTKKYLQLLKKSIQDNSLPDETLLQSLRSDQKQALQISDEKIQIATRVYEVLDQHIRRLDEDLAKLDAELGAGPPQTPQPGPGKSAHKRKAEPATAPQPSKGIKQTAPATPKPTPATPRTPAPQTPAPQTPALKEDEPQRIKHVDEDMPVDPFEPRYCICNQVSFGEMICCDNEECEKEWFHFQCVGVTKQPTGEWFCPDCRALKKKGKLQ